MNTIYTDYQATTPVDPRVLELISPFWASEFGNPHSGDHIVGWRAAEAVNIASAKVANLIGADPDEIVFTSGATEANNMALMGLARRAPDSRRRILVSTIEHKCVLEAARALAEREGFMVEYIPVDGDGFVDLDFLESVVDDSVLIVSVMAVNNEIGTIQDIPAIAALLAARGVYFHCDAAQAPAAIDASALAEHADLISLSGHKMYAPQGIGALYVRRAIQSELEPLIYGGGQQNGMRSGTLPLALCVGMGAASELMVSEEQAIERRRVAAMRDRFVDSLMDGGEVPGEVPIVNGPAADRRHPGNANLRYDGYNAQDIIGAMQPYVAASNGAACTTGIPEPSHVLRAIGLSSEQADASVRFSFGRFTTDEEITEAHHHLLQAFDLLRLI